MTGPELRDTGDRTPAPAWYIRQLAERAFELLADVDQTSPDWQQRAARWVAIWQTVRANDG